MEQLSKKNVITYILPLILPIILANFGGMLLKTSKLLGILTIILAFLIIYFISYIIQIRKNQNDIEDIQEERIKLKNTVECNEKTLNTLKDILILKGVYKNE